MPVRIFIVILLIAAVSGTSAESISISLAPAFSNLAPADSAYKSIFMNEGTTIGLDIGVRAPGIEFLLFRISGGYFRKNAAETIEDTEVTAFLISAGPVLSYEFYSPFSLCAGIAAVYIDGDYSGAGYFWQSVEGSGSSVGFEFSAGFESHLFGPVSARIEYRQAFTDITTDMALIDGEETNIYPAYATDLGFSEFRISFPVELFGSDKAIF